MLNTLYIMVGLPGSGKSTWAKQNLESDTTMYVSRDSIRFSLIKEDDSYFAKEKDVWFYFTRDIAAFLKRGQNVIADATHLNSKSRLKLINTIARLVKDDFNVIPVYIKAPIEQCIMQNELRFGREVVPTDVIFNMANNFEVPSHTEYPYYGILYVEKNKAPQFYTDINTFGRVENEYFFDI